MSENKYLELCNRVYSHIQSKSVREYYINEIKDNIEPNMLLYMMIHGFYSLDNKFIYADIWRDVVDESNMTIESKKIIDNIHIIMNDYYNTDDSIYSGHLYKPNDDHEQLLEIDDTPFYGISFNNIFNDILIYDKESRKLYSCVDAEFQSGYIDRVYLASSTRNFIRYYFNKISDVYTVTYADIFENNSGTYALDNKDFTFDRSVRYPFKDDEQIVLKSPLMMTPKYGVFEDGTDLCGEYYAWINFNDSDDMLDIALLSTGLHSGYLYTDSVHRLEDYNNGIK